TPHADVRQFRYDTARQLVGMSLPTADGATDVRWITRSYDALGRLTTERLPDGSEAHRYFDEHQRPMVADQRIGNTVRVVDAWGREQWWLSDALGRVVEAVEPDPRNTGRLYEGNGFLTQYTYDVLGNILKVDSGTQTREFAYDALGRQTAQRIPEQSTT